MDLECFSEVKTYGSIYGAVQEDKPDKERLGLSDILGRRAVIYVFPHQLLIPSWPQHSGAYVGLKGQVGCAVAGAFFWFFLYINLTHRNAGKGRKSGKPNSEQCEYAVHCACVYAVRIIYGAWLYDHDFLWHPQLSLHRITNFAVTFAGKLGSGDDIKTGGE